MWKWLRSWFAWRFSLTRLVVAVVFLGVFVGLNFRQLQVQVEGGIPCEESFRGWPFPITFSACIVKPADALHEVSSEQYDQFDWLPWTHQTYRLFCDPSWSTDDWYVFRWKDPDSYVRIIILSAIINALFALTVLALILFLHPRRKPAEEAR